MKKIITLVLAIALLMTSVVALAEGHATPNINSFATMKIRVKNDDGNWVKEQGVGGYIEITLSKPVDRLLVKWAEKGAEPEELAVGEDLKATALLWGHKYLPGTFQYYATWVTVNKVTAHETEYIGKNIYTSEDVYDTEDWIVSGSAKRPAFKEEDVYLPLGLSAKLTATEVQKVIDDYKKLNPAADYEIVYPYIKDGVKYDGYINAVDTVRVGIDPKTISTVIATPAQTAYMTVQGEWAVYYNRLGKIVGIEYFEGQF